jgi:hypothetical protein
MKWVSVQSENFEPKRNVLWRKTIVEVELLGWYLVIEYFWWKTSKCLPIFWNNESSGALTEQRALTKAEIEEGKFIKHISRYRRCLGKIFRKTICNIKTKFRIVRRL